MLEGTGNEPPRNSAQPESPYGRPDRSVSGCRCCSGRLRRRQGTPALRQVCEHIARHEGELFSADARQDVLERAGPGPWTDAVLRHARLHPLSKVRFHRSPELANEERRSARCDSKCPGPGPLDGRRSEARASAMPLPGATL